MTLVWCYGTWMVALIVTYVAVPALQGAAACLLGVSVLGAIVARVVACRPTRKLPWLLLAGAALCFAGSGLILWLGRSDDARAPSADLDSLVALAKYPLLATGLGLFARARSPGGNRKALIDAVTITAVLVMLVWLFRILPAVLDPTLSWDQKTITIAHSVGQIAILLTLARLLAPVTEWQWPVQFLAYGTAFGLAASVVFGLLRPHQVNLSINYLGWMACFALYGAAAAHPAMRDLTRPSGRSPPEASHIRPVVLTVATFVPPILLVVNGRDNPHEIAIVASAVLLWGLAQSRLRAVNASQSRSLAWERALRAAGPALASASTLDEIAAVVAAAAERCCESRLGRAAVFAMRVGGELRIEAATGTDHQSARFAATAQDWLPTVMSMLADRREPLYVSAADLRSAAGADDLGLDGEGVLLCPVIISNGPPGDPLAGVLALLVEHGGPLERWSSLQILASETGLAMERVLLTHELVRQESRQVFRDLVQDASDAILVLNDDDTVRYATPSAGNIFGDVPIVGADLRGLSAAIYREQDPASLNAPADFSELWRLQRHDGRTVRVRVKRSDLRARPSVQGRVLTLRDVTEQRRLQDELRHRAFHDSLTGLPNRFLFADRAKHALSLARRTGTVAAVLFMDLDDFKEVNDTLGHSAGDELLGLFGRRLAELARASDTAARLGGDEFALLLEGLAAPAAADSFAERVVAAFNAPFALSHESVVTTATVGVATSDDSDGVDELMRHADLALYTARAEGKRRWQRYSPALGTELQRRREIRSALEKAIGDSALALAYQPIVALGTGQVTGFESLVRWRHPEHGLLMPGQFIDIAEDTGLVVPLGLWVLRRALSDLATESDDIARTGQPYVAVNVSARQFRAEGFVTSVRQTLETSGLPPSALVLELTERTLIRREDNIGADLAELKGLGVRLAIDDFGTGYSSLSYLRELPIDVLKIDKSFVDGIANSQQQLALTRGIVQIAKTLGITTVAEGIETARQCELLTEMGCGYGQGYLLARPVAWPEAQDLLHSRHPLVPARQADVA